MDPEKVAARLLPSLLENPRAVVACECGDGLTVTSETTAGELAGLLEHAAYAHVTRRDISIARPDELMSAWQLGILLGLSPQTEAEGRWRAAKAARFA